MSWMNGHSRRPCPQLLASSCSLPSSRWPTAAPAGPATQARWAYRAADIQWEARFEPVVRRAPSGLLRVDFSSFDLTSLAADGSGSEEAEGAVAAAAAEAGAAAPGGREAEGDSGREQRSGRGLPLPQAVAGSRSAVFSLP